MMNVNVARAVKRIKPERRVRWSFDSSDERAVRRLHCFLVIFHLQKGKLEQ